MTKEEISASEMLVARQNANHTRPLASVEIGCGISTIYELERHGKIPQHTLVKEAVKKYIKKYGGK